MLTPLRLALLRSLAQAPDGLTHDDLLDGGHVPATIRAAEHAGMIAQGSAATGWRFRLTPAGLDALAAAAEPA